MPGPIITQLDSDPAPEMVITIPSDIGGSTTAELHSALSGATTLEAVAAAGFSASERTLYPEVVPAGGSITAGKLQAIIEFVQFS